MPYCSTCGEKVSDTASFCPECGSKLTARESEAREVEAGSACPSCGSNDKQRWSVLNKSWICDNCGKSFNTSLSTAQPEEPVRRTDILKDRRSPSVFKGAQGVNAEKLLNLQGDEDRVFAYKNSTVRQGGLKSLGCGLLLLIIGGIVTGLTYSAAEGGGTYIVTIGLFIAGGLALIRGLYCLFKG